MKGRLKNFFVHFVYAENVSENRRELWGGIKFHQDSPMFRNKKWIIIGYFNEIFNGEEHSSYKDSCITIVGMHEFDSVVQHCRLMNLGYQGPKFIWCNKRESFSG